ncbi:MAG: response regulator [Ignavibacteriales bacterium]|nr:response regulator [Ignavibacteriales bacterium]
MLRLLVADDEDSFRLSVEMGLKMTDKYAVDTAESGETAVEKIKSSSYDVILLDNKMPGMDGLEVVEWMHQNHVHTPVIMFTNMGSEEVIIEAMKSGVYDYLRKDEIQIGRLSAAIQAVHERYLNRRQLIEHEAEEKLFREKERDLDALEALHASIISTHRLLERDVAALSRLQTLCREQFSSLLPPDKAELFNSVMREIEQHIDTALIGIRSVSAISGLGVQKIEDIRGAFGKK